MRRQAVAGNQESNINRKGEGFQEKTVGWGTWGQQTWAELPMLGSQAWEILAQMLSWKDQGERERRVRLSVLRVQVWKEPLRRREHQKQSSEFWAPPI